MVYICILFASAVMGNKVISTPLGAVAAGSLTGPFWFILSDILAEVYGFEFSKKVFFAAMLCELIFVAITTALINAPSPHWWHYQNDYNYVEGHLFRIYFCQLLGIVFAWYINVRLLTYWKLIFNGKCFCFRSIAASGIGEIIFSVISVGLSTYGFAPISSLIKIVIWSCCLKIIFSIVFSYPSLLVVYLLKHIDFSNQSDEEIEGVLYERKGGLIG